jgi:CBS domain-containing protein
VDFKLSLQSETIRSVYPEGPVAVEPAMTIADAIVLMQNQKVAAILVCENDRLSGVFTERDVLRLLADKADLSQPIGSVMSGKPVTVNDSDTLSSIRPTEATGMVDVRGIMRYLVEHFPNTIYNLSPKSSRATAEREGA